MNDIRNPHDPRDPADPELARLIRAALASLTSALSAGLRSPAGAGSLHPLMLLAIVVIPPSIAFALAESVRGFPLVRRWFA